MITKKQLFSSSININSYIDYNKQKRKQLMNCPPIFIGQVITRSVVDANESYKLPCINNGYHLGPVLCFPLSATVGCTTAGCCTAATNCINCKKYKNKNVKPLFV